MIIVMKTNTKGHEIEEILKLISNNGLTPHVSHGSETTIIGVVGDKTKLLNQNIELYEGVDKVVMVTESYKLSNSKFHPQKTTVKVGNTHIGPDNLTLIAGPCAIESREQILSSAIAIKKTGATILRGGAYKPRSSPYSFQGLEIEGLKYMAEAREITGLAIVCEATSIKSAYEAAEYVDMIQIGARNMQNFELLKEVGRFNIPVMLKRGLSATIDEWLNASEYIMSEGNTNVVLCERGIRTFETATRNTLDLSCVPVLRKKTHLPVIVDPSHAAGHRDYISDLSKAAVAVGSDGLMIEVHPNPSVALSDGPQSLTLEQFSKLAKELQAYAKLSNRII